MIVRTLIALHLLGGLVASGLARWEIRTIVWSGPMLSLSGLLIAIVSLYRGRTCGFYLGLSTTSVVVLCISIIFGLDWSPADAQEPISSLLIFYCLSLFLPIGIAALGETDADRGARRRRRLQFSIASILWLMVLTAILGGALSTGNRRWAAASIFAAYSVVAGTLAWKFHRADRVGVQPDC